MRPLTLTALLRLQKFPDNGALERELHRTKNEQTRALLPEECVTCSLVLSSVKVSGLAEWCRRRQICPMVGFCATSRW